MLLNSIFYLITIFIVLFFFFKKTQLLIDDRSFSVHKNLAQNKKTPIVIGGIYIYIIFCYFFPNEFLNLKIFGLLILLIGLSSDKNFFVNPLLRLLVQILILSFWMKLTPC